MAADLQLATYNDTALCHLLMFVVPNGGPTDLATLMPAECHLLMFVVPNGGRLESTPLLLWTCSATC